MHTCVIRSQWVDKAPNKTKYNTTVGWFQFHYNDVIMRAMASQSTSLTIVCSAVYSGADQRKHQSSASLAFVRGIHRSPVSSPHKGPVTRKMFPFDDVIMHCDLLIPCGVLVSTVSDNDLLPDCTQQLPENDCSLEMDSREQISTKFQRNSRYFIQDNAYENIVGQIVVIFIWSRLQCVKLRDILYF